MGSMIWSQFVATGQATLTSVITWAPLVIGSVFLVLLALTVAKVIERALTSTLTRVGFGPAMERVGITDVFKRVGIVQPLEILLPRLGYYLLVFLIVRTASDSLGLTAVSDGIGAFFAYLPNLMAAVLIVLLGTLAAQLAGQMVSRAAEESGIDFAASLGSVVSGLVLFVIGIMAIGQLQIDTEIIRLVIACVLAGVALAFGLSFGLGTREITRNLIAGFYARKIFRTGEELEIRGERGVLRSITPTQTLLVNADNKLVAVSNASFLEGVVKQ